MTGLTQEVTPADIANESGVGRVVACWSPKGGVGVTTLAVNLAAAAHSRGVKTAYADLDHVWGDGVTWFGSIDEPQRVLDDLDVRAVRPRRHKNGLKGFIAESRDDVESLCAGLRVVFDLVVVDMPSAVPLVSVDFEALYIVIGCDLASLRRSRIAIDTLLPDEIEIRPIVVVHSGAQLTVDDVDDVIGIPAVGVLVEEPELVEWADRGIFIQSQRRSKWAREVRALADQLCDGLLPPAMTQMPRTETRLGDVASRLRGR